MQGRLRDRLLDSLGGGVLGGPIFVYKCFSPLYEYFFWNFGLAQNCFRFLTLAQTFLGLLPSPSPLKYLMDLPFK